MRVLKQSTAYNLMVLAVSSTDHVTGATGLTLTITASKAGGTFNSISPTVTERGNGWYSLALTTSHTDTLGDLAVRVTATGADPIDLAAQVVAVDLADAVRLGLTALPNANAAASNGLPTIGTGTGQISLSSGGVNLASTGLDAVSTTAPTTVASTFREMMVQLWRRQFSKTTLTATQLKTYANDGTTVITTQAASDDGTTQTLGAAS